MRIVFKSVGKCLLHIGKRPIHRGLGLRLLIGQEIALATVILLLLRLRPVRRRARTARAASVFAAHIYPPLLYGIRRSPSTIQSPRQHQSAPAPQTRQSAPPANTLADQKCERV